MQSGTIVFDRYGEVRIGWRLLLFAIITFAGAGLSMSLVRALGLTDELVVNMLFLGSILGASYIMTRFVNHKPFGATGLSLHQRAPRDAGIGCLLGFLMMTGIFLIELMRGDIQPSWRGFDVFQSIRMVLTSVPYFGVAAAAEEVLFRGYFFQTLIQWMTFLPATLLMAVLFGLGHMLNPHASALGLINVGLAGVWFSIAYMKTRSLWLPIGLHLAWNFSQTVLYGFPTSGLSFARFRLVDLTQTGPDWVTGGAFGPEGGILATIAVVVCTWYVLKSRYLQTPEGIVTLDSVEDLLSAPETKENRSV